MQYLPYAFFNILNPVVAVLYAATGFRIERVPPSDAPDPVTLDASLPATTAPGGTSDV